MSIVRFYRGGSIPGKGPCYFIYLRKNLFLFRNPFYKSTWPIVTAQCFTGHAASFTPTAGTQCLSRLRRARSAFRAYGGHAVPFAPTAGTQCLSRLRRAHSAFRAYGGHTVPFTPTAGTKCLSRLRRSLRKQTARSLFSAPYGKP